jgi:hypothetical protein
LSQKLTEPHTPREWHKCPNHIGTETIGEFVGAARTSGLLCFFPLP